MDRHRITPAELAEAVDLSYEYIRPTETSSIFISGCYQSTTLSMTPDGLFHFREGEYTKISAPYITMRFLLNQMKEHGFFKYTDEWVMPENSDSENEVDSEEEKMWENDDMKQIDD